MILVIIAGSSVFANQSEKCAVFKNARYGIDNTAFESNDSSIDFLNHDSIAEIYNKVLLRNSDLPAKKGIFIFSAAYAKFLCATLSDSAQRKCNILSAKILQQALSCVDQKPSPQSIRALGSAYMRNAEFKNFIIPSFFNPHDQNEGLEIRKRILNEFNVIVVAGGFKTPTWTSEAWSTAELALLEKGYIKLKKAIVNRFGEARVKEFSHMWGAGGLVVRLGRVSISGQFGEVLSYVPMQMNIVTNIVKDQFTPTTVAERLAHESTHAQDYLVGLSSGKNIYWTETEDAKIFRFCEAPVGYRTNFSQCYKSNPEWFNFQPVSKKGYNYAAHNSAEFYGKMMDEWVRDSLGVVQAGRYRCQSSQTFALWNEMESKYIGEHSSPACDNALR